MSFAYNKTTKKTVNVEKTFFKQTLESIEKKYDSWNNEINKLEKDCAELDRMFNEYNMDQRYLELKDNIKTRIQMKTNYLAELEKLVLEIKTKISIVE